jgi:MFS family permease
MWWVCGLLLLATMLNYMDRQTLTLTAARILRELRLDERHYGQLESAFAFAFALGAIVFGWMADRWNVTWVYPAAVLAWSAAGFATGLSQGFVGLLLCRFWLGLAEAGNWPCALRTTQKLVPPTQRSMGNAVLQSGAAFGAIATPPIVAALVLEGDSGPQPGAWRLPFLVVGAAGVSWVVLWLASVRPADLAVERRASPSLAAVLVPLVVLLGIDVAVQAGQLRPDWVEWLAARVGADGSAWAARLHEPAVTLGTKLAVGALGVTVVFRWLLASTRADGEGEALDRRDFVRRFVVLVVLVVAINVPWHFLRAWLPLFLEKQHHFSEGGVYWFTTAYYVSTDLGSLAAGFAALSLARGGWAVHASRVAVFVACAALVAAGCLAAAWLDDKVFLTGVLLAVGFAALGLFPNYYSFTQELSVRHQGKVTGSLGCINWLAMYALHAGVGESVKRTGSYSLGVALTGLAPLLGVAALLLLWGRIPPRARTAGGDG